MKILVAMSGGVDSSVAALLLREAGHEVVGATLCLGRSGGDGARICCGPDAIADARAVCDLLGIAHHVFDYERRMREQVIAPFAAGYRSGRTPNPCVACNRLLKFGALLERALALGFDALATGHYAGVGERGDRPVLLRARDRAKDQSYFLCGVDPVTLRHVRFPLAELTKEEVRAIARRAGLRVAVKPESQDLCFAAGRGRGGLLADGVDAPPGAVVDEDGRELGRHRGLARYTVGQRSGLGIGGGAPLYVLAKDAAANRLVVGGRARLRVAELTAIDPAVFVDPLPGELTARIRHRGREARCEARLEAGRLRVRFLETVEAAAPGQAIALYDGEAVAAGGTIESVTAAG
jgi:tRNA-specific 2-thiouridylase